MSQGSSTVGNGGRGPADKYRQAHLIDKPAARREKYKEREQQLEKDLRTQRLRYKNLEDAAKQIRKELDETRVSGKRKDVEVKEFKNALLESQRQISELNSKNEDLEHDLRQQ